MIQFIWHFTTDKAVGTEIKSGVAKGWGLGVRIDNKGPRKLLRVMEIFCILIAYSSFMTKNSCQNPSNCTLLNGAFNCEQAELRK